MSRAIVVPVIRELARCYQAFQRVSDAHIRRSGLTLVGHVLKPRPILLNF